MNLVREYINEKFVEESDPIKDMGIGLRYKIKEWIKYIKTTKGIYDNKVSEIFKLNNNGTVDIGKPITQNFLNMCATGSSNIPDTFILRGNILKKLPDYIKINKCYGNCYMNVSIIENLEGSPKIIYGSFCCNANPNLKSLEFMPKIVYKNVYLDSCGVKFTEEEVRKRCKVYGEVQV